MKSLIIAALLGIALASPLQNIEIAKTFLAVDTNKDGVLTPDEFDATAKFLDADGNGEISAAELFAVTGDTMTEANVLAKLGDVNKDGKYDVADFTASFKAMDTNGDGQVNSVEYGKYERQFPEAAEVKLLAVGAEGLGALFRTLDTDKDTFMSSAELKSLYDSFDTDKDGKVSKAEFKAKYEPTMKLTDAEGSAIFLKADTNGDGFLDDAERDNIFKAHDENGDGKVSEAEFVTKELTLLRETRIALAKTGAKYPTLLQGLQDLATNGLKSLFDSKDTDKDGFLSMSEEKTSLAAVDKDGDKQLSAAEAVPNLQKTFRIRNKVAQVMFQAVDENGDGKLSDAEDAAFYKLSDEDGDGKLSSEEYKNSVVALISMSQAVADGKLTLKEAKQIVTGAIGLSSLFAVYDTDGDGMITDVEFDKEIGQKLDLDTDLKVSPLEFLPRMAATFKISVEEADAIFQMTDSNKDGFLDKAESQKFYKSFDVDGDGKVSEYEFVKNVLEQLAAVRARVGVSIASNLFG